MEADVGGTVVGIERLPWWRPAWHVDVQRDGAKLELYARGERGADYDPPYPLSYERRVHDLLEAHGVPVPHVYGLVDQPCVMIMDRVPGRHNLATADTEEQRADVLEEYLATMDALHPRG